MKHEPLTHAELKILGLGMVFIVFALVMLTRVHRVEGRMDRRGRVEVRRACPCDSLKHRRVLFSFGR